MGRYLLKRLGVLIGALVVSLGAFLLIHALPGDPTVTILGPSDTPENRRVLLAQLGLDQPLW